MNTTEKSIITKLLAVANKISKDNEVLMSTAMLAINIAMADPKVQKAIEKSAVAQLNKR